VCTSQRRTALLAEVKLAKHMRIGGDRVVVCRRWRRKVIEHPVIHLPPQFGFVEAALRDQHVRDVGVEEMVGFPQPCALLTAHRADAQRERRCIQFAG
jgi:hypothetical protein